MYLHTVHCKKNSYFIHWILYHTLVWDPQSMFLYYFFYTMESCTKSSVSWQSVASAIAAVPVKDVYSTACTIKNNNILLTKWGKIQIWVLKPLLETLCCHASQTYVQPGVPNAPGSDPLVENPPPHFSSTQQQLDLVAAAAAAATFLSFFFASCRFLLPNMFFFWYRRPWISSEVVSRKRNFNTGSILKVSE